MRRHRHAALIGVRGVDLVPGIVIGQRDAIARPCGNGSPYSVLRSFCGVVEVRCAFGQVVGGGAFRARDTPKVVPCELPDRIASPAINQPSQADVVAICCVPRNINPDRWGDSDRITN